MGHPARRGHANVTVAVLDTGVAFRTRDRCATTRASRSGSRPAAAVSRARHRRRAVCRRRRSWATRRFVSPRDFIWDDNLPFDLDGHGTHVAGTIGQLTNNGVGVAGMAYNVRIMPVKVIDDEWDFIFGSPNVGTDDIVARGIRYAADNGAKVINMSIGREPAGRRRSWKTPIRYAVSRGVFVAVAAGNDARRRATRRAARPSSRRASTAWWPSAPWAGSLNARSTRPPGSYVEIAAPGGDSRRGGATAASCSRPSISIWLQPTPARSARSARRAFDVFAYYYFQGTSMATPHVSGLRGAADAAGHHQSRRRSKRR